MNNVKETILSQYGNSPVLRALIDALNAAVDPSANVDAFYQKMWNVLTAEGYGLDVWGRIVGVSRIVNVPNVLPNFDFKEGLASGNPFNAAPFFAGQITTSAAGLTLTDDAFRVLILVKALSNISRTAVPIFNRMLMQLFPGRGNAYVSDTGAMEMRLVFEFLLYPFEISILKNSGAFAGPTGVGIDILNLDLPHVFGFAEAGVRYSAGFNNGAFFGGFA